MRGRGRFWRPGMWAGLFAAVRQRVAGVGAGVWLGVCAGLAGAVGWIVAPVDPAGPGWESLVGSAAGCARFGAALVCAVLVFALLLVDDPSLADGVGDDQSRRRLLRLAVLLAGVAIGVMVLAGTSGATVPQAPPPPAPAPTAPDLETVLNNARNWLMGILGTIATFFLSLGAARYATANGDAGEVERAKGAFRNAAVGFSAAVLAPLVLKALRSVVGA